MVQPKDRDMASTEEMFRNIQAKSSELHIQEVKFKTDLEGKDRELAKRKMKSYDLKNQLQTSNSELEILNRKLLKETDKCSEATRGKKRVERLLVCLESEVASLNADSQGINWTLQTVEDERESMMTRLNDIVSQLNDLKLEKENEKTQLTEELQIKTEKMEMLQQMESNEISDLRTTIAKLSSSNLQLENEIRDSEKALEETIFENDTIQMDLFRNINEKEQRINEAKTQIRVKDEIVVSLTTKMEDLNNDLQLVIEEGKELVELKTELADRRNKLESNIESVKMEIDTTDQKIAEVSSEIDAKRQIVVDLNHKQEIAEKVNIEIRGIIQSRTDEIASTKFFGQSEIANLNKMCQDKTDQLTTLKHQIKDARERSAAKEAELTEMEERSRLATKDINQKSKIIDNLTDECSELTIKFGQAEVAASSVQTDVDLLNTKLETLAATENERSGHLKSERLQLLEKLNGIESDNSKLRNEIPSLNAKLGLQIDFLNENITNANELLAEAQRKIQIRREAEAKVGQMKSKVEANKLKLTRLQDEHEFICEEHNLKYNNDCKKMNDMYEEEKKLTDEMEGQISNLKAELAIAKAAQMAGPKSPPSDSLQNLAIQPKAVGPQTPKASPGPAPKASPAPKAKPAPEAKFAVPAQVRQSRGQIRAAKKSNPKTTAKTIWDDDDDDDLFWTPRDEPVVYKKYVPLRRRSETKSTPENDESKRERRTLSNEKKT